MNSLSIKYILTRYTIVYIVLLITLVVFSLILEEFANIEIPDYVLMASIPIIAAYDVGRILYPKWHVKLDKKEVWKLSSLLTIDFIAISSVIMLLGIGLIVVLVPESIDELKEQANSKYFLILGGVLLFMAGYSMLVTPAFLALGMRRGQKRQEIQAKDVF